MGKSGANGIPVAAWAVIAALYLGASALDRSLVFFNAQLSAIPLAGGIAFIAVYRLSTLGAAMIFALSFMVSLWGAENTVNAFIWSFLDVLSPILGVIFLRRVIGDRDPFGRTDAVLSFFLFAAVTPYLLTSLMGKFLDRTWAFGSPDSLLTWWLGGAIGCIISAPLLWPLSTRFVLGRGNFETLFLLMSGVLLALSFTGELKLANDEFPLQYLVFPLLLWAVFRSSLGTAVILLLISISATLWGTTEGFGPFVRDTVIETSLLLQAFFGVTGATVLILHSALTERHQAEQQVRAARDDLENRVKERTIDLQVAMREAEEANKIKSRFLAAASHDLRQPIHAISLFSTALQTRLKERENAKLVSKVQGALISLGGMLDGLLDMSRLENHAIVPQIHDFPIQAMFDEIVAEHTSTTNAKDLELKVITSSAVLRSDRTLLSRIIGNFITNAIRYTDQGRVLVGCRVHGNMVRVEIWDTGKGMSADDVEHVFDPYRRLEGARTHAADGLGLGLAICDGLAHLLEHPITVRSIPGVGSLFAIEVPKGTATHNTIDQQVTAPSYTGAFQGHTVLAVDDDAAVLDGMKTVLSDWGCTVVVARGTADALDAARTLGSDLDVVISDYHLSQEKTGIALLEAIDRELDRNVPAIIISGDTQPKRRWDIEAAGYFLLTKPIQPVSLRPLLRHLLRRSS